MLNRIKLFLYCLLSAGLSHMSGQSTVVPSCGQPSVTIVAINSGSLANPSYSMLPGNYTSATGSFQVQSLSKTYTIYVTGTNSANTVITNTHAVTVTITPAPLLNISTIQAICGSTLAVVSITPG